jgi:homoserine kinase type II
MTTQREADLLSAGYGAGFTSPRELANFMAQVRRPKLKASRGILMAQLYVLLHQHRLDCGDVDEKLLGIYRSRDAASEGVQRLKLQSGFRDHPQDFLLTPRSVGELTWADGFEDPEPGSSEGTVTRLPGADDKITDLAYVVYHEFEHPEGVDNVRLIGLFSQETDANRAIEHLQAKPGFQRHEDGFSVGTYQLDKDHWTEGFFTTSHDDFRSE